MRQNLGSIARRKMAFARTRFDGWRPLRGLLVRLQHPSVIVVGSFAAVVLAGTAVLMTPWASREGTATGFENALFTATSAVCVTGLIVLDTASYWSGLGIVVIGALIQIGGFGIMALVSVVVLLLAHRFGLRMQLSAQMETKSLSIGEVRRVVQGVFLVSVSVEAVLALVLVLRLALHHGYSWPRALEYGVFHAVSAFNNAGFALYTDSLVRFESDPWILVPVALAVIAGGLGFPVWFELWRHARHSGRRQWSLHFKITAGTTVLLLAAGTALITLLEWRNPATLGTYTTAGKLLNGFFHGVMPRTAGFNSLDVGEMRPSTLLVTDVLMFIGGGSAGTAGGIKVTTFALVGFVLWAIVRGEPSVHVMGRRLDTGAQQQALAVALLSIGGVMVCTLILLSTTRFSLDQVLFETVSAFGTVGLSTGITAELPTLGHLLITLLMFVGRLGPITLATALALRTTGRRYELPEERPIVG
ncbi:potassium transporter TrkG [Streptomonospora halophila]|uniref:Potassium transporter TrkG n=2 Tax=Streptomonospora halophila TaxID=427369 RepID=A0ABP9GVT5_9ACTN